MGQQQCLGRKRNWTTDQPRFQCLGRKFHQAASPRPYTEWALGTTTAKFLSLKSTRNATTVALDQGQHIISRPIHGHRMESESMFGDGDVVVAHRFSFFHRVVSSGM